MHLNSNDIFSQIGLVVDDSSSSKVTAKELRYKAFLEIELSQGQHQILQIKNYDDPYQVADNFCKKHRLNQLATQIIEQKIIQAKLKQQQNLNPFNIHKQPLKTSYTNEPTPKTRTTTQQPSQSPIKKQDNKKRLQTKPSKKALSPSPVKTVQRQKSKAKDNVKKDEQKKEKKQTKKNDRGNELYGRGMIKMKMRQIEYARMRQQKQKSQLNELTFQPKINQVSAKIVQFRRENGQNQHQGEKQNKKQNMNHYKSIKIIGQQLQECTFKPHINKVEMIIQNRNTYKDQYDHFTVLYKNQQYKKVKEEKEKSYPQKELFHPKINPKNYQLITQTFQERLQKSLIRKKQIKDGKLKLQEQYTFQPKIGRGPRQSSGLLKSSSNRTWWNQLYSHNLKKNQNSKQNQFNEQNQQSRSKISPNTNIYYQNLLEKRINQVFSALDADQDGYISANLISIQNLTKNELIFMKPLFEQIDELEAVLDFSQFRKALILLIQESDVQSRGNFLSSKRKNIQETTFTPEINKKSKQIICSRVYGATVHEDLYDKGLKQLQKKEFQMQRERARQEQKQLQDCSFRPLINSSSKYYIQKVLGKRIGLKHNNEQIFD